MIVNKIQSPRLELLPVIKSRTTKKAHKVLTHERRQTITTFLINCKKSLKNNKNNKSQHPRAGLR